MATQHAIQHKTTRRYVSVPPSIASGHHDALEPMDACTFATAEQAELEREELGEFKDAFEVVPVEIETYGDSASEAAMQRFRESDGA